MNRKQRDQNRQNAKTITNLLWFHEQIQEGIRKTFEQAMLRPRPVNIEYRIPHNGTIKTVCDADGKPIYVTLEA